MSADIISWDSTRIEFNIPDILAETVNVIIKTYSGIESDFFTLEIRGAPDVENIKIKSISPTQSAVGDEVNITLPYLLDMFSGCYPEGIYATHKLDAVVYFNDVEATLKYPLSGYARGDGTQIYTIVPPLATTGKITIDLTCVENNPYGGTNNYRALITSESDFTILQPSAQDELSVYQQYLQQAKIDQAWNYTHGSSDVVVAVIDDGVYTGHPDLDDNMWVNSGEIEGNGKDDDGNGYVDDKWGWDFIYNSKNMTTLGTHGTMVAGIIGAESNSATGITGINWNIKLMPIIACDNIGCDGGAIIKAIKYAVNNGADVINISLAGKVFNYTNYFDEAIKYAFDNNVLVVIAAGNGDLEGGIGRNLNTTKVSLVCNDGNQNMVLGVGSVKDNNQITSWSNYGDCVDVYASGENIVSTAVPIHSTLNGFYDTADGTSFSTPIVAGIAALIKAKYPTIKNTAIRDRIINNADYQNGLKIVNAYKAISQSFSNNEKATEQILSCPNGYGLTLEDECISHDEGCQIIYGLNSYWSREFDSEGYALCECKNDYQFNNEKTSCIKSDDPKTNSSPESSEQQVNQDSDYYDQDCKNYYGENSYFTGELNEQGQNLCNCKDGYIWNEQRDGCVSNVIEEEKNLITKIDDNLSKRVSGGILLQVEKNGEGWYVYPDDKKKYYLGRPADAFSIMRKLGLGATHDFITSNTTFPDHVLGKILLDVEQNGEAYYIYPEDKKAYYLGRPADAFRVMRELGLGITNSDIRKIGVGEVE